MFYSLKWTKWYEACVTGNVQQAIDVCIVLVLKVVGVATHEYQFEIRYRRNEAARGPSYKFLSVIL